MRGGIDRAGWRCACEGWSDHGGGFAGRGFIADCVELDFDQQGVDGTALACGGDRVWGGDWNGDADGMGSDTVWDAAGGRGFGKSLAGAGGQWSAVYSDDDAVVEL